MMNVKIGRTFYKVDIANGIVLNAKGNKIKSANKIDEVLRKAELLKGIRRAAKYLA